MNSSVINAEWKKKKKNPHLLYSYLSSLRQWGLAHLYEAESSNISGNRATIKSTRSCCTMSKITPRISRLFQLFIPWDFWQGRWKTCTRFLTSTQNISALNYAQDFGTTVKESLKWTRKSSKWATLTKSRIQTCVKYFHTFVSSLNYVSPIVANSVWQRSIRSE